MLISFNVPLLVTERVSNRVSAIDHKRVASHERRLLGGHEDHRLNYLLHPSGPSQRYTGNFLLVLAYGRIIRECFRDARRLHYPWSHGVDPDSVLGPLKRQRLRQHHPSSLRSTVVRYPRARGETGGGRNVHYTPAPPRSH